MSSGSGANTPQPIITHVNGNVVIRCPHPDCTRTFAKQANYVSHSHTGETPYRCDICGSQFRWQSSQKAHMKSHERRRQRQSLDNPGQVGSSQNPPGTSAPGPVPPPPLPRVPQPTLPAIRGSPPHSAPRPEALEPPVTPQPYRRRDVNPYSGSSRGAAPPRPSSPGRHGGDVPEPTLPPPPPAPGRRNQQHSSPSHGRGSGGDAGDTGGGGFASDPSRAPPHELGFPGDDMHGHRSSGSSAVPRRGSSRGRGHGHGHGHGHEHQSSKYRR